MSEMESLMEHERQALEYLSSVGSDCVGVIDSEEKLSAALVYHDLRERGYLIASMTESGPVYWLSNKGKLEAANVSGVMQ